MSEVTICKTINEAEHGPEETFVLNDECEEVLTAESAAEKTYYVPSSGDNDHVGCRSRENGAEDNNLPKVDFILGNGIPVTSSKLPDNEHQGQNQNNLFKIKGGDKLSALSPFTMKWRTWRNHPQQSSEESTPERNLELSAVQETGQEATNSSVAEEEQEATNQSIKFESLTEANGDGEVLAKLNTSVGEFSLDRSLENGSEHDELLETARRASTIFEQKGYNFQSGELFLMQMTTPSPTVNRASNPRYEINDYAFLNSGIMSPFQNKDDDRSRLCTEQNELLASQSTKIIAAKNQEQTNFASEEVVAESNKTDLEKRIEQLRQRIKEQEDRENKIAEKRLKEQSEIERLEKIINEKEEKLKGLEAMVVKEEVENQHLLAKCSSKEALFYNLVKEKNQLDEVRKGGLTRLEQEASVINGALMDAESAFTILHSRYERLKTVVNQSRERSEVMEEVKADLHSAIQQTERKILEVQDASDSQKADSWRKLREVKEAQKDSKGLLNAQLRKIALKEESLAKDLEQKTSENGALSKILDDLSFNNK